MNDKFPRMKHLPNSPGVGKDDHKLASIEPFLNRQIVITEKMDGSNLCMTGSDIFARSHSGPPKHHSFDMAKAIWASLRDRIPNDTALFGEWCLAKHSIKYDRLPSYFFLFGVRLLNDGVFMWTDWNTVENWADELGLHAVPVRFTGQIATQEEFDIHFKLSDLQQSKYGEELEGVVIRRQAPFFETAWDESIAKWVRENHVQTDNHWQLGPIERNELL